MISKKCTNDMKMKLHYILPVLRDTLANRATEDNITNKGRANNILILPAGLHLNPS